MSVTEWIRPWYPAGRVGHIQPDCPELLRVVPDPVEGSGWLDPRAVNVIGAAPVCPDCLRKHDPKLYADLFGDDETEDDE